MVYQYVVTLRDAGRKHVDTFSLLLLVISALVFLREQFYADTVKTAYLFCGVAIVAIICYNLYQKRKGQTVSYGNALFIAAIGWVTMDYLAWLFLPFALMGLFERLAKKPLEIGFSDTQIVINTLFRRKYKWTDLNNVILKDDLLTIDFKNDRLLQRETIDEDGDAGEDEFNTYCKERLRASREAGGVGL